MLKGASPIPPLQQTESAVANYLDAHLDDPGGMLGLSLIRQLKSSAVLLENFDQPKAVLVMYLDQVLQSEPLLKDLVRSADAEWARTLGERAHFEREGHPPHPDDPYTRASVRNALTRLAETLARGTG